MTYARNPDSPAWATTRCAQAVGEWRLAQALGISPSRVRQFTNPMRPDCPTLAQVIEADIAAARSGAGTPHYDLLHRRLAAAGVLEIPAWQRRFLALPATLRAALELLLVGLVSTQGRAA